MRRSWLIGAIALGLACDAKVEPAKTEAKAEAVKTGAVKAEPVKAEPAKVEPAKVEPEPAKVEPEPAKVEPVPVDPAKADEAKAAADARIAADVATPAEAKPVRPKASIPEQLRCTRDADCEFVARPCTCEPCGEYWREVMNRTAHQELKNRWAVRKCKQPTCPTCVSKRLGTKAVCERGKCEAR